MEENTPVTAVKSNEVTTKQFLIALIILMPIFFGLYMYNSHAAKNDVKDFATKQLISKGYEVNELIVTKSHIPNKMSNATGKVSFIIEDSRGAFFIGNASVNNVRSYLIFTKNVFVIDNIRKKLDQPKTNQSRQ